MLVHVVGGGPAGSIAAISALRNGHDALLSEEHKVAGQPVHCSGLFSKDGLERLQSFVDYRPLILNQINGAIIDLAGITLEISQRSPVAFVCDRAGLDAKLAENAENEGVRVEYGKRIDGNYASDYVIGADGPFSSVARNFNFPKIQRYASTLQADLPYASDDPHKVEVYLNNQFPGFFAWIIPHNEESAEFGVGVTLPNSVTKAWQALLKMKDVSYNSTPKGAVIPITSRPKTSMKKGKYKIALVGDAAGQTKSTTGGGVIFGGQCGMLAGKHIGEPWNYELAWRLKHGPELFAHQIIHDYLEVQSDKQLRQIAQLLRAFQIDGYLSEHGHMDRPTKMLNLNLFAHFLSVPFRESSRA